MNLSGVTSVIDAPRETRRPRNGGGNWCRVEKRIAIYLRDGFKCIYCGLGVADGKMLTLDHIVTYESGGSNEAENLITACLNCNSSRGCKSIDVYALIVGGNKRKAKALMTKIQNHTIKPLDKQAALKVIASGK